MKDKIQKLFSHVWTIPNVLTMLRLILVPVFAVLFFRGFRKASLAVFLAASLTDLLDGYLARRLNQITDFGKLFDPLADKLMVLTALICQGVAGVFPWAAILLVAGKEALMVMGGAYMLKKGIVVYANYLGKSATVAFIAALVLAFFHDELAAAALPLDRILLWVSVALAYAALILYAFRAWQQLRAPGGASSSDTETENRES